MVYIEIKDKSKVLKCEKIKTTDKRLIQNFLESKIYLLFGVALDMYVFSFIFYSLYWLYVLQMKILLKKPYNDRVEIERVASTENQSIGDSKHASYNHVLLSNLIPRVCPFVHYTSRIRNENADFIARFRVVILPNKINGEECNFI